MVARVCAVVLACWAVPIAANAADDATAAPFVTPQRDVDVTYEIAGQDGKPQLQRMRWSAALWRQRLDPPGQTSMITDYRAQTLLLLDRVRHLGLLLPAPPNQVQPPGVRMGRAPARLGTQTVAGTPCTEWRMPDDSGTASLVCFTDDGVMLRARQDDGQGKGANPGRTLVEASRVAYGRQDPSVFALPPGTRMQHADQSR